jgi:hypothetical protein
VTIQWSLKEICRKQVTKIVVIASNKIMHGNAKSLENNNNFYPSNPVSLRANDPLSF